MEQSALLSVAPLRKQGSPEIATPELHSRLVLVPAWTPRGRVGLPVSLEGQLFKVSKLGPNDTKWQTFNLVTNTS